MKKASIRFAARLACVLLACVLLACLGAATAEAETAAQKLRYIKDLTGTSCSADELALLFAPSGRASGKVVAPAYVTIIRGQLDARGDSWVLVSNDKAKQQQGWVRLDALSCI